ncbi:uncharacterized protein LOC106757846 isoform X2 [Vigna radiata var. radiata]|uniref:Uncharacterized protein LOC106757846 isoform X2 n=1 Tax=Vigna radiata var. radiata TaxID=3916 RepID=A0A3Q0ETJ5_VIGRR|nr:uncharacterized protein LOC106757846 isoform X2 [Vigna radiata var. radiata]
MRLEKLLLFWNLMLFSILVQEMVQISVQRFFRWVVNCSSPTWTTSFSLSLAAKQDKTIMAEWLPELKTAILSAQQSLEDCKYVGGLMILYQSRQGRYGGILLILGVDFVLKALLLCFTFQEKQICNPKGSSQTSSW